MADDHIHSLYLANPWQGEGGGSGRARHGAMDGGGKAGQGAAAA